LILASFKASLLGGADLAWNTAIAIDWNVSLPSMVSVLMSILSAPSWISVTSQGNEQIPWGIYVPFSILLISWSAKLVRYRLSSLYEE
jgi:hypothetical protein